MVAQGRLSINICDIEIDEEDFIFQANGFILLIIVVLV